MIQIDNQQSQGIANRHGVRQGCILSPVLFYVFSEELIEKGIVGNGKTVTNIR